MKADKKNTHRILLTLPGIMVRQADVLAISKGGVREQWSRTLAKVDRQAVLKHALATGLEALEAEERAAGRLAAAEKEYASEAGKAGIAAPAGPPPPATPPAARSTVPRPAAARAEWIKKFGREAGVVDAVPI